MSQIIYKGKKRKTKVEWSRYLNSREFTKRGITMIDGDERLVRLKYLNYFFMIFRAKI
jgi:hypothetical protein